MFGNGKKKVSEQEKQHESWAMHMMVEQYKQAFVELGDVQREGKGIFTDNIAGESEFEERKAVFLKDTQDMRLISNELEEQARSIKGQLSNLESETAQIEASVQNMSKEMQEQKRNILQSMDISKHVTTPVKRLNEYIEKQKHARSQESKGASELAKQIESLSLSAAIEAVRMGEDAKQFVDVAQQIRGLAEACQKACAEPSQQPDENGLEVAVNELTTTLRNNSVLLGEMSRSQPVEQPNISDLRSQISDLKNQIDILEKQVQTVNEKGNMISMDGERMSETMQTSVEGIKNMEEIFDKAEDIITNVLEA